MLGYILKIVLTLSTSILGGTHEPDEPATESSSSLSFFSESHSKKDTLSSSKSPIVVFKLISTPVTEAPENLYGKSTLKIGSILNKAKFNSNSITDKSKLAKNKLG